MPGRVCLDASLALMWVLSDPLAEKAEALWQQWAIEDVALVAPPLFRAEVTSVIRQTAHRGIIRQERAEAALRESLTWPVTLWEPNGLLQEKAFALATEHNQPKAYDAQYVALAALQGCELWTGDQRLVRALADKLPWVKWVGDYTPP